MAAYSPREFKALSFHDAAPRFAEGADTPRAYLERCLEAIAAREPVVRAWAALNEAGAREAADASATRWRSGRPLSPIDGLPIGIKDLLETRDMPTEMGCEAYRGNFPKRDNAAVWALRQAGAVVLGKTVTTELGGTHPGPTTNPFDPSRTPGGSSSGSAAAVAARMVPAAIGTQVGGSIVRPASYCGNVALKPTQGAINRGERQATSMSTHGVHAGCVEDMWQVAIEVARRAGGDPGRLGLFGPPAAAAGAAAARPRGDGNGRLGGAGRRQPRRLRAGGGPSARPGRAGAAPRGPPFPRRLRARHRRRAGDGQRDHGLGEPLGHPQLVAQHPDGVSARTKAVLAAAERMTPEDYRALLMRREEARRRHEALAPLVDALIAPASPGPAPVWTGRRRANRPRRGRPAIRSSTRRARRSARRWSRRRCRGARAAHGRPGAGAAARRRARHGDRALDAGDLGAGRDLSGGPAAPRLTARSVGAGSPGCRPVQRSGTMSAMLCGMCS
jgi:Asp-tRNA(Asn)/Glu-tRNA(Gln) amidotransferase A subunit family amidase